MTTEKETLMLDIECWVNYFLIKFRMMSTGQTIYFEKFNSSTINRQNVLYIINKYKIVTFNGNKYDLLVLEAACQGFSCEELYKITQSIIVDNLHPWQVRKQYGIARLQVDHIDIIELTPLKASLKIYGGRMQCETMKDLPFEPGALMKDGDREEARMYCGNDLVLTEMIYKHLEPDVKIRISMSDLYGIDLRSKSDAQIAEAVIKKEMKDRFHIDPKRPSIPEGTQFYYKAPPNIQFKTDVMKEVLEEYTTLPSTVTASGKVDFFFKNEKKSKVIQIGDTKYTVGIGGMHSKEKSVRYTNDKKILCEYDAAAFYPWIILNNKLFPKHIGSHFLEIYKSIVQRRMQAKVDKDKQTDATLKIVINGSFGKLGSKWSCLYAPDLMLQVTITGQLTLLMLVERLELEGIHVVSANTDGIVVCADSEKDELARQIVEDFEFDTDYVMERTDYQSINMRDVNNYVAVKSEYKDDSDAVKGKGAYADQFSDYYRLRSNPSNEICKDAVREFLFKGTPLKETIQSCTDVRKFVNIRNVNGGAVKEGEFLGKAIRWYYGRHELDAIYYSKNGNKVPKSDQGVPLMTLTESLPDDIDFNWYIEESGKMLKLVGYK